MLQESPGKRFFVLEKNDSVIKDWEILTFVWDERMQRLMFPGPPLSAEFVGAIFKTAQLRNPECCLHVGLPGGAVRLVLPSLH